MNLIREVRWMLAAATAVTLGDGAALAQPNDTLPPKHEDKPAAAAKGASADDRIGDPYPLDTCPITGKKLGAMGDPVTKLYDGREVRFCCPACPPKFEKGLKASVAALDEKIIKDQTPLYPLKTSVVTGKDLPAKPFEFVYGNRLIRVGAESEKADFLKDAKKFMGELDKAVVAAQGKDYPLKTCPVSKDELGGDMGKPVDVVVAGRLIRLCCKACKKDIEKDPAKFIAAYDAARKGDKAKPDADHDEKKPRDHK
jgi:hypothetical protein